MGSARIYCRKNPYQVTHKRFFLIVRIISILGIEMCLLRPSGCAWKLNTKIQTFYPELPFFCVLRTQENQILDHLLYIRHLNDFLSYFSLLLCFSNREWNSCECEAILIRAGFFFVLLFQIPLAVFSWDIEEIKLHKIIIQRDISG